MSYMSNLDYEINELLDTSRMNCKEIAERLECPIEIVWDIVDQRWNERIAAS